MQWVQRAALSVKPDDLICIYVQWIYLQAIGRKDTARQLLLWGNDNIILQGVIVGVYKPTPFFFLTHFPFR
jgi:hypothetical protein